MWRWRKREIAIESADVFRVRYQAENSLGLGRSVLKFSDISKTYFFVFIHRKFHFITVTLQRCYKYDDREEAMHRYLDVFRDSESPVGEPFKN